LTRRQVLRLLIGLLLLLAGVETFLRDSSVPAFKACAIALAGLGILLVAWPAGRRSLIIARCVAGIVFVLFAVQAAWRYPGILKSETGPPFDWVDLVIFAAQAALLFAVGVLLTNSLLRLSSKAVNSGHR